MVEYKLTRLLLEGLGPEGKAALDAVVEREVEKNRQELPPGKTAVLSSTLTNENTGEVVPIKIWIDADNTVVALHDEIAPHEILKKPAE